METNIQLYLKSIICDAYSTLLLMNQRHRCLSYRSLVNWGYIDRIMLKITLRSHKTVDWVRKTVKDTIKSIADLKWS